MEECMNLRRMPSKKRTATRACTHTHSNQLAEIEAVAEYAPMCQQVQFSQQCCGDPVLGENRDILRRVKSEETTEELASLSEGLQCRKCTSWQLMILRRPNTSMPPKI
jgi:hypothetical protein